LQPPYFAWNRRVLRKELLEYDASPHVIPDQARRATRVHMAILKSFVPATDADRSVMQIGETDFQPVY
jgi:hypothetical protein